MSSFTATRLNLLFAEAEQKGKTRHCRTYIGLGSDGLSADQLFFRLEVQSLRFCDHFSSWMALDVADSLHAV